MELFYTNMGADEGLLVANDTVVLMCVKPIVIQPSEIAQVQTGVILKVETGFVLNFGTHPVLSEKAGEIFPATITLDWTETRSPLTIPVRNGGRNPINIMPGDLIARGYAVKVESVEKTEDTALGKPIPSRRRSKPQKKNPDVTFEIKN